MRVSKWWQIFHFERTNPLKSCHLPAAITYVEQNHQLKPCIYLAMTFLFSMVSVMVIDLDQIKQFFLQQMIPVSCLRFWYLSVWSCEGQVLKAWHLFPLQHFLTWMLMLERLSLVSPALYRLHYWNKTSQYWASVRACFCSSVADVYWIAGEDGERWKYECAIYSLASSHRLLTLSWMQIGLTRSH